MLRFDQIARLAKKHSPEKEQRLLSFANTNDQNQPQQPENEPTKGKSGHPPPEVLKTLSDRQRFHDAIFDAVSFDSQKKVISDYLPKIQEMIGDKVQNLEASEPNRVIEMTRSALIEELLTEEHERNSLLEALEAIDTSTASDEEMQLVLDAHADFVQKYIRFQLVTDLPTSINLLQALLHKDIERIRKAQYQKEKGVTWDFMHPDEFEALYRQQYAFSPKQELKMPNAFSIDKKMYFNIGHKDFQDPNTRELLAARAVTNLATRLAIKNPKEGNFVSDQWLSQFRKNPAVWKNLRELVKEVFKDSPEYSEEPNWPSNQLIVEEALAIYMAELRHPSKDNKTSKIFDSMDAFFQDPDATFLRTLRKNLEERVDFFTEARTRNASPESSPQLSDLLLQAAHDRKMLYDLDEATPPTDTEGKLLIQEELKKTKDEVDEDAIKPSDILTKIEEAKRDLQEMRQVSQELEKIVEQVPMEEKDKEKMQASVIAQRAYFEDMNNDIGLMDRYTQALDQWDKSAEEGGLTREEKAAFAEVMHLTNKYNDQSFTLEDADMASRGGRKEVLSTFETVLKDYKKMFEKINRAVEIGKGGLAKTDIQDGGVWGWMNKLYSGSLGIKWMTPLNIWHVIKSYKEAIVENYKSGQLVKENAIAKAIAEKIFLFKPIEHTLKKQARSTNQKETSDFHEYIEKEGYTFDEVFGPDGKGEKKGLLFANRNNFNRAKAVLEYAADHAWLYHMDRLNGHNVYGIDFEKIEGHQSFEELVQKHESGKEHQIKHGVERVDKDPDVVPIMDAMVHELQHKNIFAVQGIMQRLQDKAKFSHSNTWMLTTLLMLIRDKCKDDPTLKMCLDKGMIDNISNHTIQQSAWSITWLKMKRHSIERWVKNDKVDGKDGFTDNGNNTLTATMEKIEKRLHEYGAHFPDDNEGRMAKYEAIAMVLSGKTFGDNLQEARDRGLLQYGWTKGKTISIFDDEFKTYRKEFSDLTSQSTCDPSKTDNDYFNADVGGSDVLLLNETGFEKILHRDSTGKFTLGEKVAGFHAQIFDRYDELKRLNPAALKNFEKQIRERMSYVWLGTDEARKQRYHENKDQNGRYIFEEMLNRNLFNKRAILDLHRAVKKNLIEKLEQEKEKKEVDRISKLFIEALKRAS